METVVPGSRARLDLVSTPIFWGAIGLTLMAVVPFTFFPSWRAWLGCALLVMWSAFFTANAVRSRRTHSTISAPVYLLAALVLLGSATNTVEVRIWMVWLLGAGIIAANLSERIFGKYL
jgi:apolipoprotein N-acyltransferase